MTARRAPRWHPRTSAHACRARPRQCRQLARPPTPSSMASRRSGSGHWRVPSGMTTHSERPARSSPATCAAHEGAYVLGSRGPDRRRPSVTVIVSASRMAGPSAVKRCSAEATSAVNALSASDPSAAWLSSRRPSRREVARSAPAIGSSSWGRSTPRTAMPAVAAIQMATTTANPSVSSARSLRAATTGSRRWGNLLDPSAPTCAHVWPSAGLANRRSASPAKVAGLQSGGKLGHLERVVHEPPHEPGDDGISHGTGDGLMTGQQAAVRSGRMWAVEEPELATLEGGHVLDQLHADVGQRSQSVHRSDDPGAVSFRADGGPVDQPQSVGDLLQVAFGRSRHHPVDHRAGEENVAGDPRSQ